MGESSRAQFRVRCYLAVLLMFVVFAGVASAQTAKTPIPVVVPPTPQVHPDGQVTFYFPDPGATDVQMGLSGHAHPLPMKKDDRGLWTITVGPLPPEIYSYLFIADGVPLLDPNNSKINPNLLSPSNYVEVPGPVPEPWDRQNVPHGVIHHHFYMSAIIGHPTDYFVYTPPGYDPRAATRYPVLYLLHGYTDDARAWTQLGRANFILDNLIAEGKARPMIVVMPLGYGAPEIVARTGYPFHHKDLRDRNFTLFTQSLLKEVIPQVESDYRVSTGREDRAIAGLSMGGAESLLTGLNHIDQFAWVGAFSAGGEDHDFAKDFPDLNAANAARLRLLWIACGTNDRYVGKVPLITVNRNLVKWLRSKNIPVTFVQTPGMHEWPVWRNNLVHFAPLLFQPK